MTPADFYDRVLVYCAVLNASMTSGRRTQAHNAAVGGVTHSAHRAGLAFDVVYDQVVSGADRDSWADRLGLKVVIEGDHDHLQPAEWAAG